MASKRGDYALFYGKKSCSFIFQDFMVFIVNRLMPSTDKQKHEYCRFFLDNEFYDQAPGSFNRLENSPSTIVLGDNECDLLVFEKEVFGKMMLFIFSSKQNWHLRVISTPSRYKQDLQNITKLFEHHR